MSPEKGTGGGLRGGEGEKGEGEVGVRVNLPNGGRRKRSDSRREKRKKRRRGRFSTLLDSGDGFSISYR